MISSVYALLSVAAPVTDLVSTRIFSSGQRPPEETLQGDLPCITFQTIAGNPENYDSNPPGIDALRVQIDSWGRTAIEADNVAKAARAVLEVQGHVISYNGDTFEPDTRLYRSSFDWQEWDAR